MGFAGSGRLDPAALTGKYLEILVPGEGIDFAYRTARETWLLTGKRVILADVQGIMGKKTCFLSVPYRNILRFSAETAGAFDADNVLTIWLPGVAEPWTVKFRNAADLLAMHAILARRILA